MIFIKRSFGSPTVREGLSDGTLTMGKLNYVDLSSMGKATIRSRYDEAYRLRGLPSLTVGLLTKKGGHWPASKVGDIQSV